MSEITAEHVAEALALAQRGSFEDEEGAGHLMQARKWSQHVPDYVQRAWLDRGLGSYTAALTRWHAELVAAERPAEDSPERLKERREALGWTTAHAGHWVPWFDHTDVERAESGKGIPAFVARYAAALSAAEAERATTDDRRVGETTAEMLARRVAESRHERAPEVVDVPQEPQPIAKRCGSVLAKAWPDQSIMHIEVDGGVYVRAPLPLLRAMLAAIDAQQRPDPLEPTRPEPRYKVGDWVRVVTGPNSAGRTAPLQVTCVTSAGYIMADGASWAADHLTPALDPARAGTEESIEASDSWGRVLAFLLALVRLGVPSERVIEALKTCVGPHDDLYAKGLRDAAAKVRELADHAGTDRGFLDQLAEDILRGN